MKKIKILVMAVALFATTGAFAQKGGWWLEGNLGVNYEDIDNGTTTTEFGIGVGANYMISKDWSIGLNIGYDMYNKDLNDALETSISINMFRITPQAIYSAKLFKNLSWTPRVYFSFGFGGAKSETDKPSAILYDNDLSLYDNDLSLIQFGVEPLAFEYMVNKHIGLGTTIHFADIFFRSYDDEVAKTTTIHVPFATYDETLGTIGLTFAFHYYL